LGWIGLNIWVNPILDEPRSARKNWVEVGLNALGQHQPKRMLSWCQPKYIFLFFFFWTGSDPTQSFWSGMTLEILKRGRRKRRRGRSRFLIMLLVATKRKNGSDEKKNDSYCRFSFLCKGTYLFFFFLSFFLFFFLLFFFFYIFHALLLYVFLPFPFLPLFFFLLFYSFFFLFLFLLLLFSSLYFPFLFSLFFFLSLILSLSGCPLFFILFFFLSPPISSIFFHPPSSPSKGVFIGAGEARATLPLSSHGAGGVGASLPLSSHGDRVRWLGRPLCSHSQGTALLFFHYGGRPWGGVGSVRVWTSRR